MIGGLYVQPHKVDAPLPRRVLSVETAHLYDKVEHLLRSPILKIEAEQLDRIPRTTGDVVIETLELGHVRLEGKQLESLLVDQILEQTMIELSYFT